MKNRKTLEVGSIHQITIEKMAHEGQGITNIEGLVVFVEGAIIGEVCKIKIIKAKKDYLIAKVEKILEPSSERIKPKCPHAAKCGGCSLQHMTYKAQTYFKKEKVMVSLKRIGHINAQVFDTIGMKTPWQYRNKSQLPVGKKEGQVVIGFYERRSHNIVNMESCMLHPILFDEIAALVKEWIKNYNIAVYDEIAHKGLIRHLVIRTTFATGEVMVVLVINGKKVPHQEELIKKIREKITGFKSLVLNINTKKTNVIMGEENITVFGQSYITEHIKDLKFRISPLSFFQVNPQQMVILYEKAAEYAGLTGKETVVDLYCGTGTITLFLAKRAKKVYGIEIVPQAIEDAKTNAKINNINNVEFLLGAVEDVMPKLNKNGIKPDVIVVDPPRRGCDEKTLVAIVKSSPKRIVYVSCNPATLARDLHYLEEWGYKTEKVQPVDMFPQTSHVECVVLMSRE